MDSHNHNGIPDDPIEFREAVAALRDRVPMTSELYDELVEAEREFAFTVANVAQADIVADVFDEIERAVRDGTTLEEFKDAVESKLEASWGGEEPGRIECLPGDNEVSGAVVRAAHRRWYEGHVCEVVTGRGRKFTATTNHPMLTTFGWKAAGKLRKGDDLVGYTGQQASRSAGDDHEAQPPSLVSEVFTSLANTRNVERVRGDRFDFHGDGRNGDVDVVTTARILVVGRFAALRKPLEQLAFAATNLTRPRFCEFCHHLVVVTERCGFCDRPIGNASALQSYADRVVASIKRMREGVGALAREVAFNQRVDGDVLALPRWLASAGEVQRPGISQRAAHAGCLDNGGHPSGGGANCGSDLIGALPSDIEFDDVRAVSVRSFRGHVFNLSTVHGYYGLAGLYTGNTIFRTNTMTAYNQGRYRQMTAPSVKAARPYWRWDVVDDARTSDDICRPIGKAKIVLPPDHSWARTHYPPLHPNCRTVVTPLSEDEARGEGITRSPPNVTPVEGFGAAPAVTGSDWEPEPADYPEPIAAELEDKFEETG